MIVVILFLSPQLILGLFYAVKQGSLMPLYPKELLHLCMHNHR